ncbi:radical SAM protein [Streptomyces sp. MAR4 CNX-425]|uniref:radical SAM protein n=1 Tax=Streptomyces sp. MAR4 CNX-425 TaxID=3406343 RepID=UPI003B514788
MGSPPLAFAALEITGRCQQTCFFCYADSSPKGTHGTMRLPDWERTIRQLAELGTRTVQFIGGEPTLHPYLGRLIAYAHDTGLDVEVFSNLVHVRDELWGIFRTCGVRLATTYLSDNPRQHDRITRLPGSHRRTRVNIQRAKGLGIPVRAGVIGVHTSQRVQNAADDLRTLGVTQVTTDRTRSLGRAGRAGGQTVDALCGQCAHEQCAIGPDGYVWPCAMGRFLYAGNVLHTPLADIWHGARMAEVAAAIRDVHGPPGAQSCTPPQCLPWCGPCQPCAPQAGRHADSIDGPD